jgi:Ca2+-binding RTX toxin-like protein
MSYFGGYDIDSNKWTLNDYDVDIYPQTPMLYDIAAIQSIYGADTTTRTTNTVYGYNCNLVATDIEKKIYDFSQNKNPIFTIWDAGGSDTLDCSGATQAQTINLNSGSYSSIMGMNENIAIAFNTTIENAKGGNGNDTLIGNNVANVLNGGTGNDTYVIDNSEDVIVETSKLATEIDTVKALVSYNLSNNIENLMYVNAFEPSELKGNASNNIITVSNNSTKENNGFSNRLFGMAGNDLLLGSIGNDLLVGGNNNDTLNGGQGADNMMGGVGSDIYVVDNQGDLIFEETTPEIDKVESAIGYKLPSNVENLTLIDSAIFGIGNDLPNTITGNSQNNNLDGGGGIDVIRGGLGDDGYFVDNTADVVIEATDAGNDTVNSYADYSILANVETLILRGDGSINGTGNSLPNTIIGNEGHNSLKGNAGNDVLDSDAGYDTLDGGIGVDKMYGGIGDDTYIVDNAGDVIIENSSEGYDSVLSSISYKLSNNLESLTLTGTAAINGTGNTNFNMLVGNSAANILDDGDISGGYGSDDMLFGNQGNDTLISHSATVSDVLTGGEGADLYIIEGEFNAPYCDLNETIAATDTIKIINSNGAGVHGFQLGKSSTSNSGVDKIDLNTTHIAANIAKANGTDYGKIHSHHISKGLITFDDVDNYTTALNLENTLNGHNYFMDVFNYLLNNLNNGDTVVFNINVYNQKQFVVFQQTGYENCLSLDNAQNGFATGLSTNGLGVGTVWII